jgi:hypothetical protein
MGLSVGPDTHYDFGEATSVRPSVTQIKKDELSQEIESLGLESIEVTPEYERSLERVLLTVSRDANVEEYYGDFIINCPEYTQFEVVVDEARHDEIRRLFRKLDVDKDRVSFCEIEDGYRVEKWAQDYTDMVSLQGEDQLLMMKKIGNPPEDWHEDWHKFSERVNQRTDLLKKCLGENQYLEVPFIFEGGNMLFDSTPNGLRVFMGYNDIMCTRYAYDWEMCDFSDEDIIELMSAYFGGAEIIVMGEEQQAQEIFHLDHVFTILDDATVVMRATSDEVDYGEVLATYKQQFEELGYRIIEVETTAERFSSFEGCVNGIPFVDQETDKKSMMFPVYADDFVKPETYDKSLRYFKNNPILEEDLTSEGLAAYRAFKQAGYEPIPVRNFTFAEHGSLHCLTNVLAAAVGEDDGVEVA